ncbi:MAG: uroporphyrinogen decarboxylase family protein [Clostridia bacterium]|nr:uroporphyrinogen decarboxylase family protein [Clostridia bacterium]
MDYSKITDFTDMQLENYQDIYRRYKKMYLAPDESMPMFVINTPVETYSWEDKLFNVGAMFEDELKIIKAHAEVGDDRVPSARVNFGTAQIAAAFGCEIFIPPDNLPCAKTHILHDINDVSKLKKPEKNDGWYGKFFEFSEFYMENLPEGVEVQLPDTQGTFNNAHLIRGNDIIFDFYDNPRQLEYFLDFITDYLIDLVKDLMPYTTNRDGWLFDWGSLWKGNGRISNCTVHLISPAMYRDFILKRDVRFLEGIGGGRIHYCGTYPQVIDSFINLPPVTGFDYDDALHDLKDICERAPAHVPVFCWTHSGSITMKDLLGGKWPDKRNIIIGVDAPSVEEGRVLLNKLRRSAERFHDGLY